MSTPAAKRRRIETASQTLSKPFRSPFKTPLKSASPSTSSVPLTSKTTNSLLSHPPKTSSLPAPRAKKTYTSPVAAAALNADPDIAPLLRAQRELERELRELKEEVDTAEQARKIEAESKEGEVDGELVVLIGKWRGASRLAAEELFGKVSERVNRMGGPRAWKEMQKRQHEFQNNWDQEEENNNDDDDDDDHEDEDGERKDVEKRDIYAEYGIDPETENEKSQRPNGLGDTGELPGQEDEFTMGMMLRTLNVDLDVIGYDKQQQRWVD
ncbi:uncharacterized protein LY89DRAFT_788713 [Mollisia scopiformis]|uniref:Uncharacterized protein n=1 Tax=Mollisia scopiformis TaxID=149040 RepID=A0A132BAD1_MOLSC|nr:uncharacterized protein LY89DRAFT_788713 [Mollisia scopiformis]KUJ08814.1 hypothetical protein LY89DRAFT_788713 [Mollisia scopiformis]